MTAINEMNVCHILSEDFESISGKSIGSGESTNKAPSVPIPEI